MNFWLVLRIVLYFIQWLLRAGYYINRKRSSVINLNWKIGYHDNGSNTDKKFSDFNLVRTSSPLPLVTAAVFMTRNITITPVPMGLCLYGDPSTETGLVEG